MEEPPHENRNTINDGRGQMIEIREFPSRRNQRRRLLCLSILLKLLLSTSGGIPEVLMINLTEATRH